MIKSITDTLTYTPASQIASRSRSNDLFAFTGITAGFTRPYTSNGLNQHLTSGSVALGYDGNGNLSSAGSDAYGYSPENRMKSAPGGTMHYDAAGRLVEYNTSVSTRFVYDSGTIASEVNNPSGTVMRRYVFGPGVDEPILWYEGAGTADKRYLHADERGSIVALSNGSGQVTQINAYDDHGIPQGKNAGGALYSGGTATTNFGRFGYTGQVWLPEIGLSHYKNRMYSPTLGRFMQPDPIGYADGVNLYAYVGGDPINARDPLGLAAEDTITVTGFFERAEVNPDISLGFAAGLTSNPLVFGNGGRGGSGGGGTGGKGKGKEKSKPKPKVEPKKKAPENQAIDYCGSGITSSIVPESPGGRNVSSACKAHDECYGSNSSKDRYTCDLQFIVDVYNECRKDNGSNKECSAIGTIYFLGVRSFGIFAYEGKGNGR